jgi:hypothetical protein
MTAEIIFAGSSYELNAPHWYSSNSRLLEELVEFIMNGTGSEMEVKGFDQAEYYDRLGQALSRAQAVDDKKSIRKLTLNTHPSAGQIGRKHNGLRKFLREAESLEELSIKPTYNPSGGHLGPLNMAAIEGYIEALKENSNKRLEFMTLNLVLWGDERRIETVFNALLRADVKLFCLKLEGNISSETLSSMCSFLNCNPNLRKLDISKVKMPGAHQSQRTITEKDINLIVSSMNNSYNFCSLKLPDEISREDLCMLVESRVEEVKKRANSALMEKYLKNFKEINDSLTRYFDLQSSATRSEIAQFFERGEKYFQNLIVLQNEMELLGTPLSKEEKQIVNDLSISFSDKRENVGDWEAKKLVPLMKKEKTLLGTSPEIRELQEPGNEKLLDYFVEFKIAFYSQLLLSLIFRSGEISSNSSAFSKGLTLGGTVASTAAKLFNATSNWAHWLPGIGGFLSTAGSVAQFYGQRERRMAADRFVSFFSNDPAFDPGQFCNIIVIPLAIKLTKNQGSQIKKLKPTATGLEKIRTTWDYLQGDPQNTPIRWKAARDYLILCQSICDAFQRGITYKSPEQLCEFIMGKQEEEFLETLTQDIKSDVKKITEAYEDKPVIQLTQSEQIDKLRDVLEKHRISDPTLALPKVESTQAKSLIMEHARERLQRIDRFYPEKSDRPRAQSFS